MKFTTQKIAEILQGEIVGDPQAELHTLSKIEEGKKGSLSFLSNEKYKAYLYTTNATAVIVNKTFEPTGPVSATLIKVEDSYAAFTGLLEFYEQSQYDIKGIEQPSYVAAGVQLPEDIYLGAFSYINENVTVGAGTKIFPQVHVGKNVSIGNNCIIHSGVRISAGCVIGNNVILYDGCVIGADGFGWAPQEDGSYKKIPQIGNVILEDDVAIGALSTIDRATLGSTIIRKGSKIDNQVQIAHNVDVGEHNVIAAQTGIAGSTKLGSHNRIGGQVGIAGHLKIGKNISVQAQSGIGTNFKDGSVVQGSPAFGYGDFNRSFVHFKNLSKIEKRISELEKSKKS